MGKAQDNGRSAVRGLSIENSIAVGTFLKM